MGVFPCGFSFVVNGAIDMYDKSLIAHLLPPEMIIKNYIHGDPDCNYEKYLLEFVNASDFFRVKSDGDIYQSPESEENGQCDCISTSYQFDFKLIASKTALQARSIIYANSAGYRDRSSSLKQNYIELQLLLDQLSCTRDDDTECIMSISAKYADLLKASENHIPIDLYRLKANSTDSTFASVDKGIHNKTTKYGLPTC